MFDLFEARYSHEPNQGALPSKIVLYQLEYLTKKERTCVIMIPFSQSGFMGSKVQWNTTDCDRYDAYKRPSFHRRSLWPSIFSNLLHFIREITNWIHNLFSTLFCSHMMLTNGSPQKATYMAPTGGLFGSQHRPEDNGGASDSNAENTPSKDSQFSPPPNQFHPSLGYSYPPSQAPFPCAPKFYHPAPLNITPSSLPSSAATQEYSRYGPSWQEYDFPQGGYSGPQIFPPQ